MSQTIPHICLMNSAAAHDKISQQINNKIKLLNGMKGNYKNCTTIYIMVTWHERGFWGESNVLRLDRYLGYIDIVIVKT